MSALTGAWYRLTDFLEGLGAWFGFLGLRFILGWEFYEAGVKKLNGENWFGHIVEDFPFPFNVVPVEISWWLATWTEIVGGLALVVGLFTRFWALSLIILTIVATAAVHWPDSYSSLGELLKGYAITDKGFGNYKLPVIFLAMLLPLLCFGPGKASVDHFLSTRMR
jgi:putative oxidoreductase